MGAAPPRVTFIAASVASTPGGAPAPRPPALPCPPLLRAASRRAEPATSPPFDQWRRPLPPRFLNGQLQRSVISNGSCRRELQQNNYPNWNLPSTKINNSCKNQSWQQVSIHVMPTFSTWSTPGKLTILLPNRIWELFKERRCYCH